MSMVKFECPVCRQNMECERACSGDVIHCPGCGAQIRIPFHNPAEILGSLSRAELVAPAAPPAAIHQGPTAAAPHQETEKREATVDCPACQAQLKVVIPAEGHAATTTLLRQPPSKEPSSPPAASEHPDLAHMTLEERERQIARAREAHPIQVSTNFKPRLKYVLAGKAPPPSSAADKPPPPSDDHHTTAE